MLTAARFRSEAWPEKRSYRISYVFFPESLFRENASLVLYIISNVIQYFKIYACPIQKCFYTMKPCSAHFIREGYLAEQAKMCIFYDCCDIEMMFQSALFLPQARLQAIFSERVFTRNRTDRFFLIRRDRIKLSIQPDIRPTDLLMPVVQY